MSSTQFTIGPGLTPQNLIDIKAHEDAIMAILSPHLVNLTPEQMHQRAMGKKAGYVDEMLKLATEQPGFLPSTFSVADFTKVKSYISDILDIQAHGSAFTEGLSETGFWYGHIAMELADRVYKLGQEEAKRGNTAIGAYMERASRYFAGQGQKGHAAEIEIGAGAKLTVDNVSVGTPFTNTGRTAVSVEKATAASSLARTSSNAVTVQPGTQFQLPDDFTAISVTNLSADTGGKFKVKLRAH